MVLAISCGRAILPSGMPSLNCSPNPRIRCCSASSLTHRVRCISVSVEPGDTSCSARRCLPAQARRSTPAFQRRFRGAIGAHADTRRMRGIGGDGDDRPAPLTAELRHRLLKQIKRAADVHRECLLPVLRAQLIGRPMRRIPAAFTSTSSRSISLSRRAQTSRTGRHRRRRAFRWQTDNLRRQRQGRNR